MVCCPLAAGQAVLTHQVSVLLEEGVKVVCSGDGLVVVALPGHAGTW